VIDHPADGVHLVKANTTIQSLDDVIGIRNRATVLRRLRWIEDRLWWHGILRRSEMVARFGISPQQASQDIATFHQVQPGFATLEASSKSYVRTAEGGPLFPKDPFRWIAEETAENNNAVLPVERLITPNRRTDPAIVAALLVSYDSKVSLLIAYQSLSRDDPATRVICPHQIVDTGHRYHVRAWDGLRGQFADFVIGRIVSAASQPEYPWVDAVADRLWDEEIDVVLAPAEGLSPAQRRIVEQDYGMRKGQIALSVRKALVTYLAESLGLLDEIRGDVTPGKVRELHCLNAEALAPFVPPR
jgi:predicted DNA-binding transcriptional regulator YafY